MDESERRKKQLAKARRLIAAVQRARLAKPGDRPDPKAKAAIRVLQSGVTIRTRTGSDRSLELDLDELERRLRRNAPGWSIDSAALRISREIAKGARYRGGRSRTLASGDPTTDYDEPTPPRKKTGPLVVRFPATDSRGRSVRRFVRRSRSGKF